MKRLPSAIDGAQRVVGPDSLDGVVPMVDFLVLAVPLTASTRDVIDRRRLSLLRGDASLVNVARGGLVDTSAALLACGGEEVSPALMRRMRSR